MFQLEYLSESTPLFCMYHWWWQLYSCWNVKLSFNQSSLVRLGLGRFSHNCSSPCQLKHLHHPLHWTSSLTSTSFYSVCHTCVLALCPSILLLTTLYCQSHQSSPQGQCTIHSKANKYSLKFPHFLLLLSLLHCLYSIAPQLFSPLLLLSSRLPACFFHLC